MSHPLYNLMQRLDEGGYHYVLSRSRDDTVKVTISFVGERVEAEIFSDGHMEVARFLGTEDILGGQELIYDLIEKNSFEDKVYEEKYRNHQKPEK
jgi:hypothetical protein